MTYNKFDSTLFFESRYIFFNSCNSLRGFQKDHTFVYELCCRSHEIINTSLPIDSLLPLSKSKHNFVDFLPIFSITVLCLGNAHPRLAHPIVYYNIWTYVWKYLKSHFQLYIPLREFARADSTYTLLSDRRDTTSYFCLILRIDLEIENTLKSGILKQWSYKSWHWSKPRQDYKTKQV